MNNNITILLVPGLGGSGPDHWQSIWEQNIPESKRVHFKDWDQPKISEWMREFDETVSQIDGPIILIGHSAGALTIVHWANHFSRDIAGALLVSPPDVESPPPPNVPLPNDWGITSGFAPIPINSLPFLSIVVASSDDASAAIDRIEYFSKCWRSKFVNIGACGHINVESGFGPWREGEKLLQELISDCNLI